MNDATPLKPSLADGIVIRDLTVDDIASLRRLHIASFRKLASSHFNEEEIAAFEHYAMSQSFASERNEGVLEKSLIGAVRDGRLVGTGEWARSTGPAVMAQIRAVFVDPFFAGCGVGQRLVGELELRIANAGYDEVGVRSTVNATAFFEQLGYRITSHGQQVLHPGEGLAVTFLRKTLGN